MSICYISHFFLLLYMKITRQSSLRGRVCSGLQFLEDTVYHGREVWEEQEIC